MSAGIDRILLEPAKISSTRSSKSGHSSVDQTRIKLQALMNEFAESEKRSEVGKLTY
jgi:hypothetical protein